MKLVELLVKELVEWPDDVTYFVQDGDREVKAGRDFIREPDASRIWVRGTNLDNYNFYSGLCTDWQTSVVTKDVYTKHKETQMKQDFHNTKIHIKSEEHSEAFQEAVFAGGGRWQHSGEFYRRGVNFIFLNDSLGMTLCDNAVFFQDHDYKEIQFPLPPKGHNHSDLMAQYAEDAKTHAEPMGFCEDTALSLAERTFSTEVDEQLAEDIIQYAQRLHGLYTTPQPPPDVAKLVEALERISNMDSMSYHSLESAKIVARNAITAYRKGSENQ